MGGGYTAENDFKIFDSRNQAAEEFLVYSGRGWLQKSFRYTCVLESNKGDVVGFYFWWAGPAKRKIFYSLIIHSGCDHN